jgi:hypothetical protein
VEPLAANVAEDINTNLIKKLKDVFYKMINQFMCSTTPWRHGHVEV